MNRALILCGFLVAIVTALGLPGRETEAQGNCFPETGFCVTNPAFMEYFRVRGGVRIMGYPVSRSFTLEGFEVQVFQRVILQLQGGAVQRLNVLDPNVMPMTRANRSVFPGPDPALAAQAPQVGAPDYPRQVVAFVRRVAPDTLNGQPVGFFTLFDTTVPVAIAFPGSSPNPDLVTLLNLEIWGLPTSNPAADPGNGGFVYQRFQRGIMHFRAEVPVTEGILVGEYLKAVLTNRALPPDLAEDMRDSRFRAQYSPGVPGWLARPAELRSTDLTGAFEPGSGSVPQPTAPPVPPTATPTPAASAPSVALQLGDDSIEAGQTVSITVIARHTRPLDWIEWDGAEGEDVDDVNDDSFGPPTDPQLARRRVSCGDRTECAEVWQFTPTTPGRYILRARVRESGGERTPWVGAELRVRRATATPTPTPAPWAPTVTLQVGDGSIEVGQTVAITVTARHTGPIEWLEWEGFLEDGSTSAPDPELRRRQVGCAGRTECTEIWPITPTTPGRYVIRARARASGAEPSPWVSAELRIRRR